MGAALPSCCSGVGGLISSKGRQQAQADVETTGPGKADIKGVSRARVHVPDVDLEGHGDGSEGWVPATPTGDLQGLSALALAPLRTVADICGVNQGMGDLSFSLSLK